MHEPSSTPARPPEAAPPAAAPPVSRQSIKYGKPPIDENASGRRARLRHPRRGAGSR
jgi:hypothetical protein